MAKLNDKPGSSSAKQHQALVLAGRGRGFDLAEIRKMVGGSLRKLSSAEASKWIGKFTDRELPHPPGEAPRPYPRRKKKGVAARMITKAHVQIILRLGREYFAADVGLGTWLGRNFKTRNVNGMGQNIVQVISDLKTAERAGQVIAVLKQMNSRRTKTA